jgi:hypothetical protein
MFGEPTISIANYEIGSDNNRSWKYLNRDTQPVLHLIPKIDNKTCRAR